MNETEACVFSTPCRDNEAEVAKVRKAAFSGVRIHGRSQGVLADVVAGTNESMAEPEPEHTRTTQLPGGGDSLPESRPAASPTLIAAEARGSIHFCKSQRMDQ
jgi:hypothetical protein